MDGYSVEPISYKEAKPWILKKHYAHRMPSLSHAFGLMFNRAVVGVVCFGLPPNYTECEAWKPFDLLELQRLVIDTDKKNAASYLVSNAMKQLPHPCVVISYADSDQGHVGYVYQATNWIFTGLGGAGIKLYHMRDGNIFHQRTVHCGDGGKYRRELERLDQIVRVTRATGKNRYYFFLGNKREKRAMSAALRYPVLPYPKGDTKRYDASAKFHRQVRLF